jgi:hypothetical protein
LFLVKGLFGLVVNFLLLLGDAVELLAHVFNLCRLRVVNIRLPRYLFVALLDLFLGVFVFVGHFSFRLLGFCQLDFDIAQ